MVYFSCFTEQHFFRHGKRYRDEICGPRRKTSSRSNLHDHHSSNYIFGMADFVSHNASHVQCLDENIETILIVELVSSRKTYQLFQINNIKSNFEIINLYQNKTTYFSFLLSSSGPGPVPRSGPGQVQVRSKRSKD